MAAGFCDPSRGLGQRLDRDHHVIGVGVNEHNAVKHDADVPLPEHEISARQPFEIFRDENVVAKLRLLHIAVARRRNARSLKRRLHKARTVDSDARAAPQRYGVPMKRSAISA